MNQIIVSITAIIKNFFGTFLGVDFSWKIILDILLTSWILYWVYIFLKKTRAIRILYGFLIIGIIWAFGYLLHLSALNFILRYFITITAFAIPVVFQPELRSLLEKIGRSTIISELAFNRNRNRSDFLSGLTDAVWSIKKNNNGALIVFERQSGLRELEENGIYIDAVLSPQLIVSIFQKGNPLHDGAILIREKRIVSAAVMIPVADAPVTTSYGTRHKAAISLATETDAVIIVVSEEKKQISVAVDGKLIKNLSQDDFMKILKKELSSEKKKIL